MAKSWVCPKTQGEEGTALGGGGGAVSMLTVSLVEKVRQTPPRGL